MTFAAVRLYVCLNIVNELMHRMSLADRRWNSWESFRSDTKAACSAIFSCTCSANSITLMSQLTAQICFDSSTAMACTHASTSCSSIVVCRLDGACTEARRNLVGEPSRAGHPTRRLFSYFNHLAKISHCWAGLSGARQHRNRSVACPNDVQHGAPDFDTYNTIRYSQQLRKQMATLGPLLRKRFPPFCHIAVDKSHRTWKVQQPRSWPTSERLL